MANRFINTSFYKSPFVRGLKGSLKSFYSYIICDCDGSGIWTCDFQIASLYIGFEITIKEFEEAFINTGKAIDLKNGKYFFPDFIEHQYPKGLSNTNPAHTNFILELKKYKLVSDNLRTLEDPLEPLPRYNDIGNGNDIGNNNGNGKPDLIEIFFNDLENSRQFETIAKNNGVTKDELKTYIEPFRVKSEPSYPTFERFVSHFKNYVVNERLKAKKAVSKTSKVDAVLIINEKLTRELKEKYKQ